MHRLVGLGIIVLSTCLSYSLQADMGWWATGEEKFIAALRVGRPGSVRLGIAARLVYAAVEGVLQGTIVVGIVLAVMSVRDVHFAVFVGAALGLLWGMGRFVLLSRTARRKRDPV